MRMSDLTRPQFQNEENARKHLESLRWPNGPVCVHCNETDRIYAIKADKKRKIRAGIYKCGGCGRQFTVTVGTVMDNSHVPLNKWLMAAELLSANKTGVSSRELHRVLGISYKTAWFMKYRIREIVLAAISGGLSSDGKTLESGMFWRRKAP